MREFSTDSAGFAALTLVEILIQELVRQELLDDRDVKRILKAAAKRHEKAAAGSSEKIDLNMESATLIRLMKSGLTPMMKAAKEKRKEKTNREPEDSSP